MTRAPRAQALSQCPVRGVCDAAHAVAAAAVLVGLTEAAHRIAPEACAAVHGVLAGAVASAGGAAPALAVGLPSLYGAAGAPFRAAMAAALARSDGAQPAAQPMGFDELAALPAAASPPGARAAEAVLCSACVP